MKFEVETAPAAGVVEVRHDLGTVDVMVRCETSSGAPVGFLAAVPIDGDRVEVAIAPGTDVAVVYVERRPAKE